jgi:hypothetical protein
MPVIYIQDKQNSFAMSIMPIILSPTPQKKLTFTDILNYGRQKNLLSHIKIWTMSIIPEKCIH